MITLTLTPPFGDGMVLQRESVITLRGTATPEESVTVRLLEHTYTARADRNGAWAVELEPQPAGGPYTLIAEAAGQSLTARDVYFGDVWLCGGQSNMELTMRRVKNRFTEEMTAHNESIRQFFVPQDTDFQGPRDTLSGGRWAALTPETVWDFSAVGYFFAKRIHASQGVPVGLLYAAAGGTPVQAWMRRETLPPDTLETADLYRDDPGLPSRIQTEDQARINAFHKDHEARDEGLLSRWYDETLPDSGCWAVRELCAMWTEQEGLTQPGIVWFRKSVPVPKSMRGQPAKLFLGCIVDSDTAFVDGVQVGTTGYRYPPREYDFHMPDKETITVAVRVSFHENPGEFVPGKPYKIVCAGTEIDLSGLWRYRRGAQFERLEPQTFINRTPTGLYNGMIAPLHRFPIRGILFYQGESNTGTPHDYDTLFCTMIEDWRAQWGRCLPFLYVQIANYQTPDFSENWPELRDRQRAALTLPDTAMIVTIDCGEDNDLHPTDKRTVGERLAAAAERIAYGQPRPVETDPCRVTREGHSLIVHFPVTLKDFPALPEGFELCGPDGVFYPAQARVSGDTVIISHPSVAEPVTVRYAWSDAPKATLYSVNGDPAGSFKLSLS